MHRKLQEYVKALNEFYASTPAFFEVEDSWEGFEWLAANDADKNIVSFIRRDKKGNEIIALISFSGADNLGYWMGVNQRGKYRIIFNSDDKKYGGDGKLKKSVFTAAKKPSHGKMYSVVIDVPKLTCLYFVKEPDPPKAEKLPAAAPKKKPATASVKAPAKKNEAKAAPSKKAAEKVAEAPKAVAAKKATVRTAKKPDQK